MWASVCGCSDAVCDSYSFCDMGIFLNLKTVLS